MNIDILLAGNDGPYIMRLADIMRRKTIKTGDTFKISLYTDSEKLRQKKGKYHIALIDEDMDVSVLDVAQIPVVILLSGESDRDGGVYPLASGRNAIQFYKYQRVSGIMDKMMLELARIRNIDKKGSAAACAFFSAAGGSGTSTMASAYAIAAVKAGLKTLYVSFECFNATEMFFTDPQGPSQGLYDIFCVIAENGGVIATLDAVKNKDKSGVEFIKRFTMWTETGLIKPSDIEVFIEAARASNGVDLVVLDMGSAITQFTEKVMECVDEIFIVSDTHKAAQIKTAVLFTDNTFFARDCMDKVTVIYNKTAGQRDLPGYDAKKVCYVQRSSGNSTSSLLEMAADELKGLVKHG